MLYCFPVIGAAGKLLLPFHARENPERRHVPLGKVCGAVSTERLRPEPISSPLPEAPTSGWF